MVTPVIRKGTLRVRIQLRAARRRRTRGQSLVEFAMILPVFALLFAATLDLGRLFYAQITLTNAAREGAFQAGQTPFSFNNGQGCKDDGDRLEEDSDNLVVCRVVLESRSSFLTIQPKDITRTCSPSDCPLTIGSTATVRVRAGFTFLTPLLQPFFNSQTITLAATATAQREFVPPPPSLGPFATAGPTVLPGECTIANGDFTGERGVYPPNVIGKAPATASDLIKLKGFVPIGEGDLTSGNRNQVREQSPDATICTKSGSEVRFKYRP